MRRARLAFIVNPPRIAPFHCLRCHFECDAASGIGRDPKPAPTAGGVSLCIRCGALAIFEKDGDRLRLRPPTEEEKREIERDADIRKIRAVLARAIAERPS